jgi:hypothetical protein
MYRKMFSQNSDFGAAARNPALTESDGLGSAGPVTSHRRCHVLSARHGTGMSVSGESS